MKQGDKPIKLRGKPVYPPHTLIEELADLHGAVDPETGHLVCHYYPIAPVIVDTPKGPVPGLQIGECITLIPGRESVEKIVESTRPLEKLPGPGRVDPQALGLALSPLRIQAMSIELRSPGEGEEPLVIVYKPEKTVKEEHYAVLVWKCKRKEDKDSPVLQV